MSNKFIRIEKTHAHKYIDYRLSWLKLITNLINGKIKMKFGAYFLSAILFSHMAFAGEWEYGLSGHAQGLYGYSDVKEHNHGVGQGNIDSYAAYNFDDETSFSLHLDLMAGIDQELQNYTQGRWGEDVYGVFDSAYGQIMLGQVWNVASLFHNGAPSVGALSSNDDIVDFIANPNWKRNKKETVFATLNSTDINTDGTAPKLNYISPEVYGTAIGFSYMPDAYSRRGLINKHTGYAHKDGFVGAIYSDHDWGFFESQASFGYAQYHGNDKEFSYSLNLSRGNWNIGGGFRKTYVDGDDKSSPNRGLAQDFDDYREGFAWNVGIGYEIGPFASALTYFDSKSESNDNRNKVVAFSNQYQFNKYIDIYVATAYVDYETADDKVNGYAFVTGLGVNF